MRLKPVICTHGVDARKERYAKCEKSGRKFEKEFGFGKLLSGYLGSKP